MTGQGWWNASLQLAPYRFQDFQEIKPGLKDIPPGRKQDFSIEKG